MIKLVGFEKKYLNKKILQFQKLEFDKTGFYLIYGRSGCGKTTLLNCISLLETFQGDCFINGEKVTELDDNNKSKIRKEYISYVHQKPVLLNDFTVYDNLKLFSDLKEGEILNYLTKFQLISKKDQLVNMLSGGEKQRISLIKSIILEKPIILCDEPTGSLDKKSSIFIVQKLKELSKDHLVIVVSHDVNLFKNYADEIILVKNETIKIERSKIKNHIKNKKTYRKIQLKTHSLERKYSKHIIKKRKIKNMLVSFFTSLSLICVSLTMLISFNVKNELIRGFSEYCEPNEIVIKNRVNNTTSFKKHSPSEEEINQLKNTLDVETRPTYSNNFETFFKDENSLNLVLKYKTSKIEGFSSRHFNEFKFINETNNKYIIKNELDYDEIVISVDNQLMLEMCYQLSIVKTFESLFLHLKNNEVYLSLFVKNFDWEYEDEQLFRLVGFVIETDKFIYNSNFDFSEKVFEENMRLPSTIFEEVQDKPWYLKKEYIFELNKTQLDKFFYDKFLSNYFVKKITYNDFHFWYESNSIRNDNLYKVFKKYTVDSLPSNKVEWLKTNDINFALTNNYYLKNNLISGFVNEIFITSDKSTLDYIEDNYFKSEINGIIKIENTLDAFSSGLLVDSENKFKLENMKGYNTEEGLGISRKLYDKLSKSLQNSTIFTISLTNRYSKNNRIYKEYVKNEIKIGKIIDDYDGYALFGNEFFISSFFRDVLGYDYEKYSGSAVNLKVNTDDEENLIRQYFYNYDVSKPFNEINQQINDIILALQIILSIFSLIIICISAFLLSLIIRSFILDFKEDLYVLYCNGLSKKDISKILKKYVKNLFIKATLVTFIFNISMSFMITFIVNSALKTSLNFSFSYESLLASFILSALMVLIGCCFVNKFIKKDDVVISIRN